MLDPTGPGDATGAAGGGVAGGPSCTGGAGGAPVPGAGATGAAVPPVGPEAEGVWDGAAGAGESGAAGGASGCAIGAEFIGTDGCVAWMGVWAALAAASAMERWNSVSPCAGVGGPPLAVLGVLGALGAEGDEGLDSGLEGELRLGDVGALGELGAPGIPGIPGLLGTGPAAGGGVSTGGTAVEGAGGALSTGWDYIQRSQSPRVEVRREVARLRRACP